MSHTTWGGRQHGARPAQRVKFTYRGCRVTLTREGWRRWRSYIAGPPGVGGLDLSAESCPVLCAAMDAIWTIQDQT
jgi:hypothetical protein